jgi:hypothetical protein
MHHDYVIETMDLIQDEVRLRLSLAQQQKLTRDLARQMV